MSSTRPREEVSSTGGLQGQKGPHLHLSLLWVSGRGVGGVQEGGAMDLNAQRGVNFSVVVSLVLFLFLFVESGGGLVSVVELCGGVGLVGGGSKTIRAQFRCHTYTVGGIHRRG